MNPDPWQLAYWEGVHAAERQQQERNQARLHRAASTTPEGEERREAMSVTVTRLLSPNRRRIVTIDEAREKADPALRINLTHAGWKEYTGPAKVETGHDERGQSDGVRKAVFPGAFNGWIIPGSDSRIDDDRFIITGRRDHDGTV